MATPSNKPVPKIPATRTPAIEGANVVPHDERVIDEAVDESFPASDPPSVADPGSTLALKKKAEERFRAQEAKDTASSETESKSKAGPQGAASPKPPRGA